MKDDILVKNVVQTGGVPIVFGTDIAKSSSALTLSKRIVI